MAKESFGCDQCDRKGFKHEQGLKHHKTSKHGLRTGRAAKKTKGWVPDLATLPRHPNTTPTVREELLDTLRAKKNQVLAQVAEIDDMIEKLGG